NPSTIESLARAIFVRLKSSAAITDQPLIARIPPAWTNALLSDLSEHRGRSLIVVGAGQPPIVHALGLAINDALGNLGQTLTLIEPVAARAENQLESLKSLVEAMRGGDVETLVILGGNPLYAAPAELDFAGAMDRVPLRVHMADYEDETSFHSHWHVP